MTYLAAIALVAAAAPARADDDPEALIAHGVALREQGKDDEALAEFRRAFAIAPTPRARAQMALAEQALGLWAPAEEHLGAALKEAKDPWIQRNKAPLAQSMKIIQQHLGTLVLRGGVDGAEVLVDGAKIGALPLPPDGKRVEAGQRTLEVRADGYYPISRIVTIPPGETARETIELQRRAPEPASGGGSTPPPAPTPPANGAAQVAPGSDATGADRAHAGGNPPTSAVQDTMGWVLLAAGGAFVVTGVVAQVARQSEISNYNDDASCPGVGQANQSPSCQSRITSASTWQTVSIVGFVAGGALAVGGLVLVVTAPSTANGGTASLGLRGRF